MWDFRRSVPKTGARERGQVGDHLPICVITWDNVAFHHSQWNQSMFWHLFENDVSFPCPLLPFSQPHWDGRFWPNVPPWCNGCWMPRHHSWSIPGRIRHTKRFFPRCLAREVIMCYVDENMCKCRRPGRLDYIFYLFFLLWIFLFVYSHNKWQLYCFFFLAFLFF